MCAWRPSGKIPLPQVLTYLITGGLSDKNAAVIEEHEFPGAHFRAVVLMQRQSALHLYTSAG